MLQQILQDMFIDPELLAELDEEQKQVLFCKIREEQIRRWKEREQMLEAEEKAKRQQNKEERRTKVGFLLGADGQPWTWVMGDHPSDKTVEQILENEARIEAAKRAEQEAEELRRRQDEELKRLKEMEDKLQPATQPNAKLLTTKTMTATSEPQPPERTVQMRRQKPAPSNDVESIKSRRSNEIFQSLKLVQQKSIEQAEQDGEQLNEAWLEQERKAKQAEEEKRLLARRAREDHRLAMRRLKTESQIINAFALSLQTNPDKPIPGGRICPQGRPVRPTCKADVLKWYKEVEEPKGIGLDPNTKRTASYFYGLISREEAEARLENKPPGTFLIRLSDRVWGYALSIRGDGKSKHYLIDASDGRYRFFGTNQLIHISLDKLVENHRHNPVSIVGNEMLEQPCGNADHRLDVNLLPTSPGVQEVSYL